MPILCYRKELKIDNCDVTMSFSFNCIYDDRYHLKLKDYTSNYFDSGDFNIKIDESINRLNSSVFSEYKNMCNDVFYVALFKYFYDNLPGLYSIRFESNSGDSIYYADELKK